MSDLNKLMAKMNNNKKPAEKPVEQPAPAEKVAPAPIPAPTPAPVENVPQCPANVPQPAEIPDDIDEEDIETVSETVNEAVSDADKEEVEQVPATQDDDQHSIEQEVAVLQNVGIYRREMILIEKEKTDVLKVMAQTLLEIKKKLLGEEDAPKG